MGGFTKIPKLSVGDLGSEGTGDRIALFDAGGRLVGYKMNTESGGGGNFVPLSGTVNQEPITGDLEISQNIKIFSDRFLKGSLISGSLKFSDGVLIYEYENSNGDKALIKLSNKSFNIGKLDNGFYIRASTSETETDPSSFGFLFSEEEIEVEGVFIKVPKITVGNLEVTESTQYMQGLIGASFYNKRNDPNAFAQLGDLATTLVRETETITNLATVTDAFIKTIEANTIGENDVINGNFIFNCLVSTTKVDYKVIISGIEVAVFNQVGYQDVNQSTEISIKVFRDENKLKISSTLIGGITTVSSFYYETTSFDFLENNDLKLTMNATNANEVSFQFAELILSK